MLDFNSTFSPKNSVPERQTQARGLFFSIKDTTICFYVIICGYSILHISFDKNRHQKALRSLHRRDRGADHFKNISLSLQDLRLVLANKSLFPPFSSSPFLLQGSPLQKKVWDLIARIPFGETRTYGELAKDLGNSGLARAVGNACNKNPVALLIPCHRVVGKYSIGGFAGGSEIKKQLLELER